MTDEQRTGLDERERMAGGQIHEKERTTRVRTLRETYGQHFAAGESGETTLGELLDKTGSKSLHDYIQHHHKS